MQNNNKNDAQPVFEADEKYKLRKNLLFLWFFPIFPFSSQDINGKISFINHARTLLQIWARLFFNKE